jgi:hypothetical protein
MFKRKSQTWKLQKPMSLGIEGEMPLVMAYTKGKKNLTMIPLSDDEIDNIFGDAWRLYVKAEIVDGMLKVNKQIKNQDW